jgi:hypothetical protein
MREPLVYEGRVRVFDPEPGDVIYLTDHPSADEHGGPNLTHVIEKWRQEWMFGEVPGRFRITVEELPDP